MRYFALLREQACTGAESLDTAAATAGALYAMLAARHAFSLPQHLVRAVINERYVDMDAPLADGDRVVFIPPVAGG